MIADLTQVALFAAALLVLAMPLGAYIARVATGEIRFLTPVERAILTAAGVDGRDQRWTSYATTLSPEHRTALGGEALEEARRLDRYVQNLLDMTRLGYGALEPRRAVVDLREIVGRVRSDLARVLARHRLEVDVPRDLPRVDVDPVLIGQALTNVVENATKYGPVGSTITLRARPTADHVVVTVKPSAAASASSVPPRAHPTWSFSISVFRIWTARR
jgi:signal transduction histidine kinase